MSDHDPNGDDAFLRRPRTIFASDDDDNPMHRISYGRGDDMKAETAPGVGKKVETIIAMEVVNILTVKDIILQLIEPHTQAWKDLPKSVRDAMMDRPQNFQLRPLPARPNGTPDIVYNGTVWRHWSDKYIWSILEIK